MIGPVLRDATLADVDHLAAAMIAAEKSGTDRLGLAALCGLTEAGLRDLFIAMLREEVDGCEFSVSSFAVAELEGRPVAAVAGWVESLPDGVPSMVLKANLMAFTFPSEALALLRCRIAALSPLQIERERLALQIEYVYVEEAHRGMGLAGMLIERHVERAIAAHPAVRKAQVQLFSNNHPARRLYELHGFQDVGTFATPDAEVGLLLPCRERLLMEAKLIQNDGKD